jgi:hypothetical protein
MMSDAMDPELQQLASQAVNYQAAQHLQLPSEHDESTDPVAFEVDGQYICPFPTCARLYKRKDLLKRHLTTLNASPDENHRDQSLWEQVKECGIMMVYTRPRNLTEDQKKQRRRDSNLRHRVKYASELKEKRNRKRRVDKLLEGRQVGVQTPDWDEEAREQAVMEGVMAGQVEVAPPVIEQVPEVLVQSTRKKGRGRSKQ